MWLDRLASQSTPSGSSTPQLASRSYSPLPRRSSSTLSPYVTSQRPGHSPRGSTLSLVSNDSTASLLASSKRTNGSGLRQSTSFGESDSMQILERLLGTTSANKPSGQGPSSAVSNSITHTDLALEFSFGGRSLQDLATEDDKAPGTGRGADIHRPQTVEECTCAHLLPP